MSKSKDLTDKDLIDLDTCVERIRELWNMPKPPYSRRTLQNKLCNGAFRRYGPYHHPMVDWNEVKALELKKRAG